MYCFCNSMEWQWHDPALNVRAEYMMYHLFEQKRICTIMTWCMNNPNMTSHHRNYIHIICILYYTLYVTLYTHADIIEQFSSDPKAKCDTEAMTIYEEHTNLSAQPFNIIYRTWTIDAWMAIRIFLSRTSKVFVFPLRDCFCSSRRNTTSFLCLVISIYSLCKSFSLLYQNYFIGRSTWNSRYRHLDDKNTDRKHE